MSPASRSRDALTPDERALAARLARPGQSGEPSPALDARVLDAARSAVSPPVAGDAGPRTRQRTRRRWPVAFGAAATLVIVGGLAWQLRPLDEIRVEYSEAPRAVSAPSADAATARRRTQQAQRASAKAAGEAARPVEPGIVAVEPADAAPTPPASTRPPRPIAEAPTTDAARPAPTASRQPPPAEPPVVFDQPAAMATPAAPAPAPAPAPPPVREVAPTPSPVVLPQRPAAAAESAAAARTAEAIDRARKLHDSADAAARRRAPAPQVATGAAARAAPPADAAAAADAGSLDRVEATGARIDGFGDQPADDLPPASADSPRVQQAWLQRVRQLVAEGRRDDARESLREYRHRYPEAALPEDLRALLAE